MKSPMKGTVAGVHHAYDALPVERLSPEVHKGLYFLHVEVAHLSNVCAMVALFICRLPLAVLIKGAPVLEVTATCAPLPGNACARIALLLHPRMSFALLVQTQPKHGRSVRAALSTSALATAIAIIMKASSVVSSATLVLSAIAVAAPLVAVQAAVLVGPMLTRTRPVSFLCASKVTTVPVMSPTGETRD